MRESKSRALPLGDTPMDWGEIRDLNPWPSEPQSDALPTALISPHYGVPEGIRTPGPQLRRLLLYPAELQAQIWSG